MRLFPKFCSSTACRAECVYPDHGKKSDTLIKNADIAMYSVKTHGRSGYTIYEK